MPRRQDSLLCAINSHPRQRPRPKKPHTNQTFDTGNTTHRQSASLARARDACSARLLSFDRRRSASRAVDPICLRSILSSSSLRRASFRRSASASRRSRRCRFSSSFLINSIFYKIPRGFQQVGESSAVSHGESGMHVMIIESSICGRDTDMVGSSVACPRGAKRLF